MFSENKYLKYTLWILLIVLIIFILGQLTYLLDFIKMVLMITLLPVMIASLFYYLFRPLVNFLVERKINKTVAVVGVLVIVIALVAALSTFAGRAISDEFSSFADTLSEYSKEAPKNAESLFGQDGFWFFSMEDIETNLYDSMQTIFQALRDNMFAWVGNVVDAATVIILIPIAVFFLLRDDEFFYKNMVKLIPKRIKDKAIDVMAEIDGVLQDYFMGQLMVAGVLGVLTYIGYLIIGLPNALFLASFSMVLSIIPFLGPLIGILPAMFIGWTVDLLMVGKVLIVLTITQQLEGNVVRPNIMGNRLKIHPLVIIFLVVIAVSAYGFMGAFFVIPLYAMVRIIVKEIVKTVKEKKEIETDKK